MVEFYKGTLKTMIERLQKTITSFNPEWNKKCIPATEKQIQRIEKLFEQYHYSIPATYLAYLKAMGQNDGGLLEREWDGCEPGIDRILECYEDKEFFEYDDLTLEKGYFLFSYHWTDAHMYLKLEHNNSNPSVVKIPSMLSPEENESDYVSGSFEKYLFQKAFKMYQDTSIYKLFIGTSANDTSTLLNKYLHPSSVCGGTSNERMELTEYIVSQYNLERQWFSDNTHYFSYNEQYALEINTREYAIALSLSCNDTDLRKKASKNIKKLFNKPATIVSC